MLLTFLTDHQEELLALTAHKALQISGVRPTSKQLKRGLPIFFRQLLETLQLEVGARAAVRIDEVAMARASGKTDEVALALASGRPDEAALARTAGAHGKELYRLGYTLSHVVHAYGSMCQAITELAGLKNETVTPTEFHDLNRCLDVAIAGAVTEYQFQRNNAESDRETRHLGFLAHELRNTLNTINISLQLLKSGAVGFGGSTGAVLDKALKRQEELIDRSLTEVRLRIDPKIHIESGNLLHIINQIVLTAEVEARARNQVLEVLVDPDVNFEADQQLLLSAISNLIQNAMKYTHPGGKIQVRGNVVDKRIVIEVEDECGGLKSSAVLFKPFEQNNANRKGLGLGLTIAQRAIALNQGTLDARDLPGKGCVFKISLPIKYDPALAAQVTA